MQASEMLILLKYIAKFYDPYLNMHVLYGIYD